MEHRYFRSQDGNLNQTFLVRRDGHRFVVRVKDKDIEATVTTLGEHRFMLHLPDRRLVVDWARRNHEFFLQLDGETFRLHEEDAAHSLGDADHGEDAEPSLNAPLPGKLVKILVKIGDQVKKGQAVAIIDSMKMEFELKAHRQGTVDRISAQEGKQLEVGQSLMTFK